MILSFIYMVKLVCFFFPRLYFVIFLSVSGCPSIRPSIYPSSIEPSVYRSVFAQIFCKSWNSKYISLMYRHLTLVVIMKVNKTHTRVHLEYNRYGQNWRKQINNHEVLVIKSIIPRNCPINMMTSSNGNILRVTGNLCGEFTGPRWIPQVPHTKASDAELWCLLWYLRQNKRLSKQSWGWWF